MIQIRAEISKIEKQQRRSVKPRSWSFGKFSKIGQLSAGPAKEKTAKTKTIESRDRSGTLTTNSTEAGIGSGRTSRLGDLEGMDRLLETHRPTKLTREETEHLHRPKASEETESVPKSSNKAAQGQTASPTNSKRRLENYHQFFLDSSKTLQRRVMD